MDLRLHIGRERGDVVVGKEPQQMHREREHLLGFGEILEPLLGSEALEPLHGGEVPEILLNELVVTVEVGSGVRTHGVTCAAPMLPHPTAAFQRTLGTTRKSAQQIVILEFGYDMQVDHHQREQPEGHLMPCAP